MISQIANQHKMLSFLQSTYRIDVRNSNTFITKYNKCLCCRTVLIFDSKRENAYPRLVHMQILRTFPVKYAAYNYGGIFF